MDARDGACRLWHTPARGPPGKQLKLDIASPCPRRSPPIERPSSVMRSFLLLLSIAAITVLALGEACATLIPGSKRPRNDCLIEADVADVVAQGPTAVSCTDGDACDHDGICVNQSCRFRMRVCVNQANVQGCAGRAIAKARAAVKLAGKKKIRLPLPADLTGAACGSFV